MWGATFACKSSIAAGNPQLIAFGDVILFQNHPHIRPPSGAPSPSGEGFGAVRNLTNKQRFVGQFKEYLVSHI